ncbi:hypothetical protein [Roseivirga thermotolerans]|uniref:hypothetical protein n=1 Tax=Roseivirga thermotolerans TaxID=1758176 RepID=UPI00273D12D3|nr:hypothetical protein [Roseivirga thermotolerans]MEC7752563.1 hypothetical protein [Bacteroidota bacterium]
MEENKNEEKSGIPIPQVFLNTDTGGPIERCIQCDYQVLDGGRHYMIEKVFKRYPEFKKTEVLFEYAICSKCYEEMKEAMSAESMQNLSAYMMGNMNFSQLQQRMEEEPDNPEHWLSSCLIKGTPKEELREYQMGACFKGDRLVMDMMPPFLIGEMALEELNALLSKETKDEMDGFMGDHFGIPPELRKDLILI